MIESLGQASNQRQSDWKRDWNYRYDSDDRSCEKYSNFRKNEFNILTFCKKLKSICRFDKKTQIRNFLLKEIN